jgi:ssDNA-specific exonuclease RecJ
MYIKFNNSIINLKQISRIGYERNTMCIYFIDGHNGNSAYSYDKYEDLEKDFELLYDLISKAQNLDVDKNGRFICSHCGAPN